jgi:hypothetical protein
VTIRELKVLKSKVCHADKYVYILFFPRLNMLIEMYIPRIVSAIKVIFQMTWRMEVHTVVNTLSAAQ